MLDPPDPPARVEQGQTAEEQFAVVQRAHLELTGELIVPAHPQGDGERQNDDQQHHGESSQECQAGL